MDKVELSFHKSKHAILERWYSITCSDLTNAKGRGWSKIFQECFREQIMMDGQAPQPIKVAIIEDRREIREGLAMLISGTEGFRCTGAYRSMEEALDKIGFDLPDVALNDIGLPGMSGIDGIKLLKERHPELLILMLTVYDDDERIFDAMCAGASGYLLKKTPPARLLESLKEAVAGGAPMSPEVARRVISLFR